MCEPVATGGTYEGEIHTGRIYTRRDTHTEGYTYEGDITNAGDIVTHKRKYTRRGHTHEGTHTRRGYTHRRDPHTKGHTRRGTYTQRDIHSERNTRRDIYMKGTYTRREYSYTEMDIHTKGHT